MRNWQVILVMLASFAMLVIVLPPSEPRSLTRLLTSVQGVLVGLLLASLWRSWRER